MRLLKRTVIGSSTSGSGYAFGGGSRWHCPHISICAFAENRFGLTIDRRIAFADAPVCAADTCACPGPWQRSQVTPGIISDRSGAAAPGIAPVEWQLKHSKIVFESCGTPNSDAAVSGRAGCPNVRARRFGRE